MQRGAGGTSGGLGQFFVGLIMVLSGAFLFARRLEVTSSFRALWGGGGSGLALIILLAGIGVIFFSGRSIIGWLLILAGVAFIIFTVISNLVIYLRPTSLFETVLMLGLMAGGLGVIARSLRPH